jgi:D-glycero-beta-D-manno-heptose-7-phosphate kinase
MPDVKPRLTETTLLVAGDVMLDRYWFGDVERISPEAPVPIVHVQREEFRLGGAANVALNVAALGARVTLMSVIGSDEAGARLRALLTDAAIGTVLREEDGLTTTVKLRVSGRSQQLLRMDFERPPAADSISAMTDDFRVHAGQFDAVILSDYGKGGLSGVAAKIAHARELGVPVFVDPKGRDYVRYKGATAITPNRAELATIIGPWSSDVELATEAQRLRADLDFDAILLTRSEEGMSLFDSAGEQRVPAHAREVFDVTGAGDTCVAVLATLVAAGLPIREAVPLANRACGLVVGRFGTASVTADELFANADDL